MKKEKNVQPKDKKEKSKNVRYFFTSMMVTLCVAFCIMGIITVDYNTRWVGFGNDAPIACVTTSQQGAKTFDIHVMGVEKSVDVSSLYKATRWTQQAAQQAAELIVAVYDDIWKMFTQLFK
jgi:hypothetical protein